MEIKERLCKNCQLVKPLSTEFWIKRKSIFRYVCRSCENENCRKYYQQNKQQRLQKMKEWKSKNHENIKQYRQNNKERAKLYKLNNADKYKEYYKNRERKKRLNPIYKLHCNMSRAINRHLKSNFISKNEIKWLSFVTYSIEDLKNHIESKFLPQMTWENYGKWHIDHIKPKSLFNIKDQNCEEFKKCWSLDNLQPLWATDNIKKGNRFIG